LRVDSTLTNARDPKKPIRMLEKYGKDLQMSVLPSRTIANSQYSAVFVTKTQEIKEIQELKKPETSPK
jgi:hypothetical protein